MDLNMTPAQEAFRDEVRSFVQLRLPHDIRERLRLGHPPRKQDTVTWQRILNERLGQCGAELGQMERLILMDELYRAPAPLPQVFNVTMLGPVLMKFGTPEQCSFFLPKLANLDLWFCQGFSEPGSGSDLASLRTAARREGEHYIVNGQKIWTTTAHMADWVFALVRTDSQARKQEGISFLLIDLKTPGITIRPIVSLDGDHHLNEVFFDEVRVPVGNLVGEENKGWNCAKYLLANERTGIANVGLCRERLDHARELASRHTQGGKPLLDDSTGSSNKAWPQACSTGSRSTAPPPKPPWASSTHSAVTPSSARCRHRLRWKPSAVATAARRCSKRPWSASRRRTLSCSCACSSLSSKFICACFPCQPRSVLARMSFWTSLVPP